MRAIARMPMQALLRNKDLRARLVFELKREHFDELDFSIPLGWGLNCPIAFAEAGYSFFEIFLEGEYAPAFETMSLPERWIDLGCHAGFFSLFVAWLRAKQGLPAEFNCLLIDADLRMELPVRKLIDLNHLSGNVSFRRAMIGGSGQQDIFAEGAVMSSSAFSFQQGGTLRQVPVLGVEEIFALLPPPYDLIKIDVEGSEFSFLLGYGKLLQATKYLLLEWHSWHAGAGGKEQICQMARSHGFVIVKEVVADHEVQREGQTARCGTILFEREMPEPVTG